MPSLRLAHVSFSYSDSVPLFSNVTCHMGPHWTGLVGGNGCGKTTFLRLLSGELKAEAGQLCFDPPRPRIRHCSQELPRAHREIRSFAASRQGSARRLMGRLGLVAGDLDRWPTLSPGERKRWQIGAALAAEPEVLLLDEPTNHLDSEARQLLLQALSRFPGMGVLVSHDRVLLNQLTTATLRMDGTGVRLWPGAYDAARQSWLGEEAGALQAYQRVRREEKKLHRRLADRRQKQRMAESQISFRSRKKGKRDHDRGSMAAKNRVKSAEARLGRQVAVVRRKLEDTRQEANELRLRKSKGGSLFVDYGPAPVEPVLALATPCLQAGPVVLLRDVHLTVERSSRVWLKGPNGSGKSTLLRGLVDGSRVPVHRLLYLPQELTAGESQELLDTVRSLRRDHRGRILELAAALGADPERLLASSRLSPGEARKLKLAVGLGRRVWALLLDEPTNHLDLPTIEALQAVLTDYPGALILVTHDEPLARSCTQTVWRLSEHRVRSRGYLL